MVPTRFLFKLLSESRDNSVLLLKYRLTSLGAGHLFFHILIETGSSRGYNPHTSRGRQ